MSFHILPGGGQGLGERTSTSSKPGKSEHRPRHLNGAQIPETPTQYVISARRAASSRSAKSAKETVLSYEEARATVAAKLAKNKKPVGMCIVIAEALHGKFVRRCKVRSMSDV